MPSLWIIDGFNLVRQSRDLMELEAKDLSQAKLALLGRLQHFSQVSGEKVLCVWDATGSINSRRVEEPHGTVVFLYTKAFETADEAIMELASDKKAAAIVVSSDREILEAARKAGSATMKSEAFDQVLFRMQQPGFEREEPEGFDPKRGTKKKGPSHRRPKVERKVHSKLRKIF